MAYQNETWKEWFYYEFWLGFHARVEVIGHWLQGHDVRWRYKADWWSGCGGDIMCMNCPESSDGKSDILYWCRHKRWMQDISQILCSLWGHTTDVDHPQKGSGRETPEGDPIWEPIVNEWYCRQCGKDISAKRAAELIDEAHELALKE